MFEDKLNGLAVVMAKACVFLNSCALDSFPLARIPGH
tara:strand:- start:116 stop:226 length:111 start_codon:yes stop_codon:yes gene_type:complete